MTIRCKNEHTIIGQIVKKLSTTLKTQKMGVWHAWARQNDNTKELQVGCAASRHHSVSEVYTEQKFPGCTWR